MSGSAAVAGSKRSHDADDDGASPAAAAASRVTTRSQDRAMADQPTPLAATAVSVALSTAASDAGAAALALPSSAAAAAVSASVPSAAAAAASSSRAAPRSPASVPPRRADPPSLFCANSPDPLSLILSFVLIDLPIATGQPYFPKELVRLVHEYASEACFIVRRHSTDNDGKETMQDVSCSSSKLLLQRLAKLLPSELSPYIAIGCDVSDVVEWIELDDPECFSYCSFCLLDEDLRMKYGQDTSLLLHAQLRENEYRTCSGRDELEEQEQPINPMKHSREDSQFCSDGIRKRVAAIVDRGQKPVAVGLSELLKRVRKALKARRLPRGLSARPCDWSPLFEWIRDYQIAMNELQLESWADSSDALSDYGGRPTTTPVLSAVLVRSTTVGDPVSIQGEAAIWPHAPLRRTLTKPAASMMIDENDDDGGGQSQFLPQPSARSSGSASSAAASSAASASTLSADAESAARAAPRRRR